MYKWILLIIGVLFISSCDMTWKRPLKEKHSSKSAYEQCIQDNPNDQSKCDPYKEAYDDSVRHMKGKTEDPNSEGGLYEK